MTDQENIRLQVPPAAFVPTATVVDEVPVQLSYGIIDRFSEGLYSSPNKAFEELITNSYDAGAKQVWVYLPEDLTHEDAALAVIDDGESMSLADLQSLWWIGRSRKRSDDTPRGRANPIGKFGIGKLATYALANTLTYFVHQDERYYAVTMDFAKIAPDDLELSNNISLLLQVVELTQREAIAAVACALEPSVGSVAVLSNLNTSRDDHWTIAILSNLKPAATKLQLGRLRWVLRTALPLNSDFDLFLNDERLESSKISKTPVWTFICGKDEEQLPAGSTYSQIQTTNAAGDALPAVQLPSAGRVSGSAQLYADSLKGGKSDELGRSFGFFVRVRGRLINTELEEGGFGVRVELRHGTLSRFHMEVEAPDLDDMVASARESLRESEALNELRKYLLAVFNRARTVSVEEDSSGVLSVLGKDNRLSKPPRALTQGPLRRMLRRAVDGDVAIQQALGLGEDAVAELADALNDSETDVVQMVVLESGAVEDRLVNYDPGRRAAIVNLDHPFIANYASDKSSSESLRLFGLAELLTEAYMLDEDIPTLVVSRVVRRRDAFLSALVKRFPHSAKVIANNLLNSRNDEDGLEEAVGDALELFGFEVRRWGGSNHGTDGVAIARLGIRSKESSDSYSFTYDCKSKGEGSSELIDEDGIPVISSELGDSDERIRADTARTAILKVHREEAAENHSLDVVPVVTLLVAPDFQGWNDSGSQIYEVCRNDGIVPLRVRDLAHLVELFPLQGLNPLSLKPLFALCSPQETRDWVESQKAAVSVPKPPIGVLIDVIVRYSEMRTPTTLETLIGRMNAEGWDDSREALEGLVRGLAALAPASFYFDGVVVALNATPANLFNEIRGTLEEFTDQASISPYLSTLPPVTAES